MENVIEQINKISHLHTRNVLMKQNFTILKKRNTILVWPLQMKQTSVITGKVTGPNKVVIRLNSMGLELI